MLKNSRLSMLLAITTGAAAFLGIAPPSGGDRETETHALFINGGKRPAANALSHLHHLQDMLEVLRNRGIPLDRIHIFSGDGEEKGKDMAVRRTNEDPRMWLIEGLRVGRELVRVELVNTLWEEVSLQPARLGALRDWFRRVGATLHPGDTLLVFVTDHGSLDSGDTDHGLISLWNEDLSVPEFRDLLGHLQPEVRVVNLMSQCYSGSFAEAMVPLGERYPQGNVCGFYSTSRARKAYGCYPEGRDRDRIGHAFRFIDALDRHSEMISAHREVILTDSTPDVPLSTSDLFLQGLLEKSAATRGVKLEEFVDARLDSAWKNRARWEPEIRLLDRIGEIYGTFSPRSLSELRTQMDDLEDLSKTIQTYKSLWKTTLDALKSDNLQRFLVVHHGWEKRLLSSRLRSLTWTEKRELREKLLRSLRRFTERRLDVWDRLERLREASDLAASAHYRTEVRRAALLRMRATLMRIAGRELLATGLANSEAEDADTMAEASKALSVLEACEATQVGELTERPRSIAETAHVPSLPPFEEDRKIVERVLPSWLGIRFRPLNAEHRENLEVERGAVVVQGVNPDSPAGQADLRPGDVILGPPGDPITQPRQIREWTMSSPRETPLLLAVLRGNEALEIAVSLGPYPTEIPRFPTPPQGGDTAPELGPLKPLGAPRSELRLSGTRHMLFFWATWCAPCKTSLAELMAWAGTTEVPVIAITDEEDDTIAGFLEDRKEPFPENVVSDQIRRSHLAYAISGTPTFILVGADGVVEWRQTGYSAGEGLSIDGWSWSPPH